MIPMIAITTPHRPIPKAISIPVQPIASDWSSLQDQRIEATMNATTAQHNHPHHGKSDGLKSKSTMYCCILPEGLLENLPELRGVSF
jgi:hypothetical protein